MKKFKIMEFCGAISVSARYDTWGSTKYYNFVAVTGLVIAVLIIILTILNVFEKLEQIPWMFIVNKNKKNEQYKKKREEKN
jgi:hypothetical protein